MSLELICEYKRISEIQRATELRRGEGLEGTKGFKRMGCYECKGYVIECDSYTPVYDPALEVYNE